MSNDSDHDNDHQPIEPHHYQAMLGLGQAIKELFPDRGWCILMFDWQQPNRMNYLSNARRQDMIAALKEFIARAEGHYSEPPTTHPH